MGEKVIEGGEYPPSHENEHKEKAIEKKGVLLDSVTVTMGSAAKGTAVALKGYVDMLDVSDEGEPDTDTEKKIENMIKIRQKLQKDGLIIS